MRFAEHIARKGVSRRYL